jgi:hypothetical protein
MRIHPRVAFADAVYGSDGALGAKYIINGPLDRFRIIFCPKKTFEFLKLHVVYNDLFCHEALFFCCHVNYLGTITTKS